MSGLGFNVNRYSKRFRFPCALGRVWYSRNACTDTATTMPAWIQHILPITATAFHLMACDQFCNIKKQQHIPLTKPFTRPNASTMQRGADESIGTTFISCQNAMDQGQQCAACRRLVNYYFELTLSSIRLTSPRWSCGVFDYTPVTSFVLARRILMHT